MAIKMTIKFFGRQRAGILSVQRQDEFRQYLKSLGEAELEIVVRPHRKQRSDNQNRYYHGVVLSIISDYTGMTPDEVHEYLKSKFLSEKRLMRVKDGGVMEVLIAGSSAALKTDTMEAYLSMVRMWAGQELGCYIPEPNETVEQ